MRRHPHQFSSSFVRAPLTINFPMEEGDLTLVNGIAANCSDNNPNNSSYVKSQEEALQLQSSNNDEETNPGFEALLRRERLVLNRTRSRMLLRPIVEKFGTTNVYPEIDRKMKDLGDPQNDLEMTKEWESANCFIKNTSEFKVVFRELCYNAYYAWRAYVKKLEEVNTLVEALNQELEDVEKKTNISGKAMTSVIEEHRLVLTEKWKELEATKLKAKLTMEKKEEQIFYYIEQLVMIMQKTSRMEQKKVEKGFDFSWICAAAIISLSVIIACCLGHKYYG